jgi:hypothetical protein
VNKIICDSEIFNTIDDISLPSRRPPCLTVHKKRTKRVNDDTQIPNKLVDLNITSKKQEKEGGSSAPKIETQFPPNVEFEEVNERQGRAGRVGVIREWGGGGASRWTGRGSTQGRWTGRGSHQPSRWTGRGSTNQLSRWSSGRGGAIRGFGGGGNWGGRGGFGLGWNSGNIGWDNSFRMGAGSSLLQNSSDNNLIWTENNDVYWCNQYKCILIKTI